MSPKKRKQKKSKPVTVVDLLTKAVRIHGEGDLAGAENLYRQVLKSIPDQVDGLHCMGLIAFQRGQYDLAEQRIIKAIAINPTTPAFHCNLGQVYRKQGRLEDAIRCYRRAIELQPDYTEAYNHLGSTLNRMGDTQGAVQHCQKAIELAPGYADAHNNLAGALVRSGAVEKAIEHYEKAIEMAPQLAEAHNNLGGVFFAQGRIQQAKECFRKALELNPKDDSLKIKLALSIPPIYQSVEEIETCRKELTEAIDQLLEEDLNLEDPVAQAAIPNFYLVYQGLDDREVQEKIARIYRSSCSNKSYQKESFNPVGDNIRVGFVSAHFHNHTIGKLTRGLIANLSREEFSVSVFSIEPKDDDIASRIKESADRYIPLPNQIDTAAKKIMKEDIDLLFYADIGMHPLTYFLALSRLAPVQCVTWGHPVTTGIDTVDYFIATEDLETEEGQKEFTEKLVRLKSAPTYYYPPSLPFPMKDRLAFGFSEEQNLYVCPQSLFKFHPDFDKPLSQILKGDPNGQLVLIEGGHGYYKKELMRRFLHSMPEVVDRIVFLPHQSESDFLSLIAISDVMLDTYPFGGGNTTYEALATGTPVVTLPTDRLRGRITYGIYKKMDWMECVASSPEEYSKIALRLGMDKAYQEQVREEIQKRRSIIYEDIEMVRELERFFRQAVQQG